MQRLRLACIAALLISVVPTGTRAAGMASVNLSKTVSGSTSAGGLSQSLAVDKQSAIPGDTLTFTSTVSNSSGTLTISGQFIAQSGADVTSTVAAYCDAVEYRSTVTGTWIGLAGTQASQPGYVPQQACSSSTGMVLTAQGQPASGVTYGVGDQILDTQIQPGSTATWNYQAVLTVTAAQVQTLDNTSQVSGLRNVIHFELTPRDPSGGQPFIYRVEFTNPFPTQGSTVTNVTVTINPPTGRPVVFNCSNTPALCAIPPGGSVTVSTTYKVPPPAAKGSSESDSAYQARLASIDGSRLQATASASGTSNGQTVTAPPPLPVSTVEHLPILTIAKSGPPAGVDPGTTQNYPITLKNTGGATAGPMTVTDTTPNGGSGTVTGVPASLAPGASATANASYTIPSNQPPGPLTDTAGVTWQDANRNSYGPVSSSFTTTVNQSSLQGASLTLAPITATDPTGTPQTLTVTLLDRNGQPISNQTITFNVTGPNATSGTGTTDASGHASFTYTGKNNGTDQAQAMATANGITLNSNTVSIGWITPVQYIMTTTVQGNFYAEPSNPQTFVATPADTPAFGQQFPNIAFDPPAGTINHQPSSVNNNTRPFIDLTTDEAGNFFGSIVAQGNGIQAGVGNLSNFDAVFTATFVVAQAGDIQFNLYHDDGWVLGVGGGATRVNGAYVNPPASGTTVFQGYPVVAADNQPGASTDTLTIHFPAAGSYPYELDYFEANSGGLSLTLFATTFFPQNAPLSVYVGYADGLRAPGNSVFPFPWQGSPGVTFIGNSGAYDAGALRFDNSGASPINLDSVTVDLPNAHFDIWPRNMTIPAGQILILTQTQNFNFDSSDFSGTGCGVNNGVIPKVNVTIAGSTQTFNDSSQVINTGGFDLACQGNESHPWVRVGGGGKPINIPVPPAASLVLSPQGSLTDTVGQVQKFIVAAMDGSGQPVIGQAVTLGVFGANTQQLTATTDMSGNATFTTYVGKNQGTDTVTATSFVTGMRAVSSATTVQWTIPTPGTTGNNNGSPQQAPPAITSITPADGTTISSPTPVTATISPPQGETVATWSVAYQAQDVQPAVTFASGVGTPPSPLATFDPTLLPNDTYALIVTATASGGGTQTTSTTLAVKGDLKVGRYQTTYQDLNVPVNGYQMQVRRTYDSYDKRVGDFGVGWHVSVANFRTSTNRILGAGGWTLYPSKCVFGFCSYSYKTSVPHFVTVTYPDGHQELFNWTPTGGAILFYWQGSSAFTAQPGSGTTSTLQSVGDQSANYDFAGDIQDSAGKLYNPSRYQLTTRDNKVLVLDVNTGLVSETDPSGNRLTVDSSGVHSFTGTTAGPSIGFTRDAQGRITSIAGPAGESLAYAYSPVGDLASFTDAAGNTIRYVYDTNHDLLTTSGPSSIRPISTLQYDSSGRLVAITDGDGNTTQINNNVSGQQQTITDPAGKLTTIDTFDALGDLLRHDQVFGGKTLTSLFTYDAIGHLLSASDPLNQTTTFSYDAAGDVLIAKNALGQTASFSYDAQGHLLTATAPDSTVVATLTYNSIGLPTQLLRADGTAYTFAYDSAGRPTSITDPLSRTETRAYDSNGHLQTVTDNQGNATTYSNDGSGRVLSVKDAGGNTTTNTYDGDGNLLTVTDTTGGKRTFVYDAMDHVVKATDPLGNSSSLSYGGAGRLTSVTDRNGGSTGFSYDADGRLVSRTLADASVTHYAYDGLGRLAGASNPVSALQFAYDDDSRVTSQTTGPAGGSGLPSATLNYAYDVLGRETSVAGPSGTTNYIYDARSRLSTIADPSGGLFTLSHDPLSRLTSIQRPNGVADSFTFDSAGELLGRQSTLNGATLAQSNYTYDAGGRRVSLTDQIGTSTFNFSNIGMLVTASHPPTGPGAESYGYDSRGNRTSAGGVPVATYDAGDRLLTYGTAAFLSDKEGNLTQKVDTSGLTSYSWNSLHQLTGITFQDLSTESFKYDPLGRRVEANSAGQITRYIYDGANPAVQYNASNSVTAAYVNGLSVDSNLEEIQGSTRLFPLRDGNNSTTALTDTNGAVQARYTYDTFGNQTKTGLAQSAFTYTGREFDAKSGLYYNRARYYNPSLGRFLSEDPLPRLNPYSYAQNDPVNHVDPFGAQAFVEDASIESQDAYVATIAQEAGLEVAEVDAEIADEVAVAEEAGSAAPDAAGADSEMGQACALDPCAPNPDGTDPQIKTGSAGGETAGQAFPQSVRQAAFEENPTNTCVYCGRPGTGSQIDHVIPKSQGGNATLDNAQVTCDWCNPSKGASMAPKNPPPGYVGPWPPTWWPDWLK